MTMIRVSYANHTSREVEVREVAFGDAEVEARGPIVSVTLAAREDRSPDAAFPNHNRVSRSIAR